MQARWESPHWPHSPEETRSNVGGYDVLGENLSYCGGTGCADDPGITDGSGKGDGEGWWEERNDYNWADDSSNGVTSHYTQMVSSNVYAIGCATQRCDAPGPFGWDGEWWWTICQYGPRGQGYWARSPTTRAPAAWSSRPHRSTISTPVCAAPDSVPVFEHGVAA
ncbi:MAG: CAP domain-containing protein [Polyangiaceae bacterium]|nr:CAP domain-containing protein [Myxococcales bacterium]MCB9587962.1 CAP domain-containing protein [Polyangiaceae bacterium]